jgi:hypothetical protein
MLARASRQDGWRELTLHGGFLYVHATLSTQASNRSFPRKVMDLRHGVWTHYGAWDKFCKFAWTWGIRTSHMASRDSVGLEGNYQQLRQKC